MLISLTLRNINDRFISQKLLNTMIAIIMLSQSKKLTKKRI